MSHRHGSGPLQAEVEWAITPALPPVLADPVLVEQVLINLVRNAADAITTAGAGAGAAPRVRVSAAAPGGARNFAIRPYPSELVETIDWQGRALTLRPIRPEDEAQHLLFLAQLDPVDIRMRLFYSRRSIERSELARLTQIDYEREMAFIATAPLEGGGEETLGVARALCDPDNQEAEFGIVVRSDLKGGGLGEVLMRKLIAHLRARGTRRLVATVLNENTRMLELARELGFEFDAQQPDPATRRIHLPLTSP